MNKTKLSDREVGDKKVVFFGAWVGEFGWEVGKFQPRVRAFCENNPNKYVIVMSEPGHELFYESCDEFWEIPDYFLEQLERDGVWRETTRIFFRGASNGRKKEVRRLQEKMRDEIKEELEKFPSYVWRSGKYACFKMGSKSAKKLSTPITKWSGSTELPYFCVSYRHRGLNTWGNWSLENWSKLVSMVQEGTGVTNYRVMGRIKEIKEFGGEPPKNPSDNLVRSIDLLNHCEFSVTPESGSGFLSTACGARTIVFGKEDLRVRYTKRLNPLGTPICYVGSKHREFTPEMIYSEAKSFLQGD